MEAGDVMTRSHLAQRRDLAARPIVRARAAVGERAGLRELAKRGHATGDLLQAFARALALVRARHRAEQAERVRMLWVREQLAHRGLLGLAPGVHDDDAIGD